MKRYIQPSVIVSDSSLPSTICNMSRGEDQEIVDAEGRFRGDNEADLEDDVIFFQSCKEQEENVRFGLW